MSLASTLAIIVAPWALSKALAYWRRRSAQALPLPAVSAGDVIVSAMLVVSIVATVGRWATHENLFQALDAPRDAPVWLLRARLKAYAATHQLQPSIPQWHVDATDKPMATAGNTVRNQYDRFSYLLERFRASPVNRDIYTLYSHDSLLYCDHCQSMHNHLVYSLPTILAPYVFMLLVCGLATMRLRKAHWRMTATATVTVLMFIDLLVRFNTVSLHTVLALVSELTAGLLSMHVHRADFAHSTIVALQAFVFTMLLFAIWAYNVRLHPTPSDQLRDATQIVLTTIATQQIAKLAHAAVMTNASLRQSTLDYHRRQQSLRQRATTDDVNAARHQAAQEVVRAATASAEQTQHQGHTGETIDALKELELLADQHINAQLATAMQTA